MNAIYRQPGTGNDYVFVVTDNKVSRKPVERVETRGSFLIITGIEAGQTLVLAGKNKLTDGAEVAIKEAL